MTTLFLTTMRLLKLHNKRKNSKVHVHSTIVRNEATGTHKLNLSDDFSLKNRTLDMFNEVGLIQEVIVRNLLGQLPGRPAVVVRRDQGRSLVSSEPHRRHGEPGRK